MIGTWNLLTKVESQKIATINFAYAVKHSFSFVHINVPCFMSTLGSSFVKPWGLQAALSAKVIQTAWVLLLDHDATFNPRFWDKPITDLLQRDFFATRKPETTLLVCQRTGLKK